MSESIDYNRAFKLADRYAEYRLMKSWGIMMLVTAIVLLLYQILMFSMMILRRSESPDFDLIFWWINSPISYLFFISFLIIPLILAIATYISTKRTVIERDEITKVIFSELQKLLQLTAGNLDHHLKKLEEAKYIVRRKELFPKRTQTMIRITKKGNDSFRDYSHRLRAVFDKIE